MKGPKVIDVAVIVFPNGETYWTKVLEQFHVKNVIEAWKAKHKEYENTNVSMSIAQIKMLEKDYDHIPATNGNYELDESKSILPKEN